jgi:hypothetical protein
LKENILEKRSNQNNKPSGNRQQGSNKNQPSGGGGGGGNNSSGRPSGSGQKKRRKPGPQKTGGSEAKPAVPAVKQHDFSVYLAKPAKKCSFKLFETFAEARNHAKDILEACKNCDQLNVVIRAEGDMNDAELVRISPKVMIFAGAAWTLIHERRVEEKWYESTH